MADKPFKYSVTLTNTTTTNILSPGTTTGGTPSVSENIIFVMTHVRVVNTSGTAATVSLWVGGTGTNATANTFAWSSFSIAGNSFTEWFGEKPLFASSSDFLVGGSGTNGVLVIDIDGYHYIQ